MLTGLSPLRRVVFVGCVVVCAGLFWNAASRPVNLGHFVILLAPFACGAAYLWFEERSKASQSSAAVAVAPGPVPPPAPSPERPRVVVDLSRPDRLPDGCVNCGNALICYSSRQEANKSWDFICPDYQRDETLGLSRGPRLEVGR